MGVAISTHTSTSPLTLVSTVIGFLSFGFTLGTFFKVVWVNLSTLGEAPHEVHAYLTNIRSELVEEAANLRYMKRGARSARRAKRQHGIEFGPELDEVTWKLLNDSLRYYCRQFKELEQPFLDLGEEGIGKLSNRRLRSRQRNSSVSPSRYSHGAYASPPEKPQRNGFRARDSMDKDAQRDLDEDGDPFWAQRTNYAPFTLKHRLQWLTRKSKAENLVMGLTRLQIRRMALQIGGMTVRMHEHGHRMTALDDTLGRIDERVSRVIGVRRISE